MRASRPVSLSSLATPTLPLAMREFNHTCLLLFSRHSLSSLPTCLDVYALSSLCFPLFYHSSTFSILLISFVEDFEAIFEANFGCRRAMSLRAMQNNSHFVVLLLHRNGEN